MKKLHIAALTAALLSLTVLAACGEDAVTENSTVPEIEAVEEVTTEAEEDAAEDDSEDSAEADTTTAKAAAETKKTTASDAKDTAEQTQTEAKQAAQENSDSSAEEPTEEQDANEQQAELPEEVPAENDQPQEKTEAYLLDELRLGDSCTDYVTANPDFQFEEAESCIGSGKDRIYTYPDFQLFTYFEDGVDTVREIFITADSFETRTGIRIGSSTADVVAAYGEPAEAGFYVYETEDGRLEFFMDGDTVSKIDFIIQD